MKGKDKKKQTPDSKKKQLLNIFHQTVQFLQIFSLQEIEFLTEKIHIFVFSRGNYLAKEKEYIDFVGVIAEGRATCKGKSYQIGDIIGYNQLLGIQNLHQESIMGESDGIIIAIRIIDLLSIQKVALKNKIMNKLIQIYINKKLKRQQINKAISQYQTIDQKKVTKLFTPQWNNFVANEMDAKEKLKFQNYFPYYKIKQKDIVANNTSRPYLILLLEGQLIVKNKYQPKDHKIIEPGNMFNQEGFIFNQIPQETVYCLSAEAIVCIIDKNVFLQSFKTQTFRALSKMILNQIEQKYLKQQIINNDKEEKDSNQWSMFKKYPNISILPLPKKSQNSKMIKAVNSSNDVNLHLNAYQTLFRQQLGVNSQKVKTGTSQAQSGYEKLFTTKTQPAVKELQNTNELQRLRKEVEVLAQKLKFSEEINKINRLDLIQSKSRLNMQLLLKQISQFYSDGDILSNKTQQQTNTSQLISLKEAFDKQMISNKTQMLVAKCAFKWLHITRKRKAQKPI